MCIGPPPDELRRVSERLLRIEVHEVCRRHIGRRMALAVEAMLERDQSCAVLLSKLASEARGRAVCWHLAAQADDHGSARTAPGRNVLEVALRPCVSQPSASAVIEARAVVLLGGGRLVARRAGVPAAEVELPRRRRGLREENCEHRVRPTTAATARVAPVCERPRGRCEDVPKEQRSQMRAGNSSPSRGLSSMSLSSPSRGGSRLPVCHMCGRQFGSASLEIHQRTCRERYERERGRPPPGASRWRDVATFTDDLEPSLARAPSCLTGLPCTCAAGASRDADRRGPTARRSRVVAKAARPLVAVARRLKLPVCHMCSKQFGSASHEIHRTCRERYERERGQPPPPTPADGADAFETFTENLEPCEDCGRTFLPDRLIVHQRSCGARRRPSSYRDRRSHRRRRAARSRHAGVADRAHRAAPWAHKIVGSPLRPAGPVRPRLARRRRRQVTAAAGSTRRRLAAPPGTRSPRVSLSRGRRRGGRGTARRAGSCETRGW